MLGNETKKIVITGGCGFIGVNLVKYLLGVENHIAIRIVDNFSVGKPEDLKSVTQYRISNRQDLSTWDSKVTLIEGEISDFNLAETVCDRADVVIHLAANTGVLPSIEDPKMDYSTNMAGTFSYLEACRKQDVKRFILASSGATLGDQEVPIHEEMVAHPISPYGASKLCGEAYCSAYFYSYGIETISLRFGNVYGPHSASKSSVVAKFIRQILSGERLIIYGDGKQTRDFIHVDDLCSAIRSAVTEPHLGGEVFQIATNNEHSIGELVDHLKQLSTSFLGTNIVIEFAATRNGEVIRNYSDISKAKNKLNWEPKWPFSQGIDHTFKWFLNDTRK